jgi:hypothetical protein
MIKALIERLIGDSPYIIEKREGERKAAEEAERKALEARNLWAARMERQERKARVGAKLEALREKRRSAKVSAA